MQIFWLAAIVMLGTALFVVLGPLFRRSGTRNVDANTVQVDIYRTRLQEMETEMANGLLSAADAEAARTELARTLLQVTDTNGDKTVLQTGENTTHHWWAAGVIAVLVPIIAVSLYNRLGSPHMITGTAPVLGDIGGEAGHKASIDAMVKYLAERLEQNPNDPEGWMMLTNSYITLGKLKEALSAIERLYQISGDEPAVLVRYADILATVKGGDLSGRPTELIQKALSLDPDNKIGLWLAGIASARAGDPGTAIEYWHRLLPLLADDPASQKEVSDLIAQASGQTGGIPDTRAPSSTSASTPGTVAGVTNSALNIKVSLSAEISQDLSQDQSLFIVAKAVNGPPMPVAVIRKTAAELPLEITMDDNNAMMPSRKLSSFAQVEVSARISPSGNAIPQAGDLVSSTLTVSPGQADPVVLVIDRKVP